MELRQLQTFGTIAELGSFVRAAEALEYAQSTITLHIQQLEAELGVSLFERKGKRIRLTEAGRTFRDQAGQILSHTAALHQSMTDLVAGEAGHLRVGATEPTASLRLPPLLATFCSERPKVRLTLEVAAGRGAISQRVAAEELDIGLGATPSAVPGIIFEPFFTEAQALLLPTTHRLASKDSVCVADLTGERLLLKEETCAYRQVIERELLQHGMNPFAGIEIGSLAALQRLVQCGLGLAIIPVAAASPPLAGTILRELRDVDLSLCLGLVRRMDQGGSSPAMEALVDCLRRGLSVSMGVRNEVFLGPIVNG